jgi:inorganic phosphate transporter, PiT family
MWFQALLLVLTFVAVALVSGNNLSACVGPAIGSKTLSKRAGILLGSLGFSVGLAVQGSSMIASFNSFLPKPTLELEAEILLVAILVFVVADLIRAPISLSMCLVGLFMGLDVASGGFVKPFTFEIIAMWAAAPIAAIALAFYLTRLINRRPKGNIWRRVRAFKLVLILLAFSTSYVLGANTLGLIVAVGGFNPLSLLTAIVGVFVGSFLLSKGELKRVSQELFLMHYSNATVTLLTSTVLVETATLFNIPLSNTQALSAALFGTGFSYKTKLISLWPFLIITSSWIIAPLLGFAAGLFL